MFPWLLHQLPDKAKHLNETAVVNNVHIHKTKAVGYMSAGQEEHTVTISDKDLIDQLKTFAEENEVTTTDVIENALRSYFGGGNNEDQPPDDDVFNPDPGA